MPLRRAEHERTALRGVAAHGHESLQRLGLQRCNQPRGAAPERAEVGARRALQLVGNLQQVADDHLVVGIGAAMVVDGFRDVRRFRRGGFDRLRAHPTPSPRSRARSTAAAARPPA